MKKHFSAYEIKSIPFELKDFDEGSRKVKIALSAFDVLDSDGDIIRKGAFAKSIQERGPSSASNRKIAFLRDHSWTHQIGKFLEVQETAKHLEAVGQLGRSTKGQDALFDYQDGIIMEHSIGFNYVMDKIKFIDDESVDAERGGYWEVTEVNLWEGSPVAFGANQETPVLDVAKGNKEDILAALNKEMDKLQEAIRNGKGTDDRLYSIEMGLKVIQQKYNSLISCQPGFEKPTVKEGEPNEAEGSVEAQERRKTLLNLLKP